MALKGNRSPSPLDWDGDKIITAIRNLGGRDVTTQDICIELARMDKSRLAVWSMGHEDPRSYTGEQKAKRLASRLKTLAANEHIDGEFKGGRYRWSLKESR